MVMETQLETEFVSINLKEMIEKLGENKVKDILSCFECEKNPDVQNFLRHSAIEFSKQGIAQTHLVYWRNKKENWGESRELVGYYTISSKSLEVHKNDVSKTTWKRIVKFGKRDINSKKCIFPALLIGQLGKNYAGGNNFLISGNQLLELAIRKIRSVQNEIGGKFTYLECEDIPQLISFYEGNGFRQFGKRQLDGDETDLKGEYLIQFFRYL